MAKTPKIARITHAEELPTSPLAESEPAHFYVEGKVQAVGYRHWSVMTATELGLRGWVRNRTDGSVEILLSGETATKREFMAAALIGPRHARVAALLPIHGSAEDLDQLPELTNSFRQIDSL
ncbi:MAG: acylphosphatase [Candidatus Pacebacteria bacterium]|nr:acylphosphatase [Candidatus Paceibacterota bacterium]